MTRGNLPVRESWPDFAGRMRTLPDDIYAWEKLADPEKPKGVLVLGIGPGDPEKLKFIDAHTSLPVYWLDSQVVRARKQQLPTWPEVSPAEALALASDAQIWFYRPGLPLDPDFWTPFLARLDIAVCSPPGFTREKAVWLPGGANDLLYWELAAALKKRGINRVISGQPHQPNGRAFFSFLGNTLPALVLSVNFRGLDPEGKIASICAELGIPLAVWLVDNPWNIVSRLPLPWWKNLHLFITDPSFMPSLKNMGCEHVEVCPLASSSHMWRDMGSLRSGRPLFVGRAAFPGRSSFFKGCRLPQNLLQEAENLPPAIPDWHWWHEKLGIKPWPGLAGRAISYGADIFSARNRAYWLKTAGLENLEIIGDDSWRNLLPGAAITPPVDYYGSLPECYHSALAVLNVTSLLLPQSLSQRHFDVWAAGGYLLSDDTAGLKIFPDWLVREIVMKTPEELPEKLARLRHSPASARELIAAWREELTKNHSYENRLDLIAAKIGAAL